MAKHTAKITLILLAMFIATQLIGLTVINFYLKDNIKIPYGFDEENLPVEKDFSFYLKFLVSFVVSLGIAIVLVLLLMKIQSVWFIRGWFFVVISLALGITLTVITTKLNLIYPSLFALVLGIFLAFIKVFRRNIIVHNITELLIYPGIAVIFVAMFNLTTIMILLFLISAYDIWAVWHTGIMQKMAKFQINTLGIFSGFFLPYASKETKEKIKLLKLKYKDKEIPESIVKRKKLKISLAILGGGDVIFPIIAAGVFLKTFHSLYASLTIVLFATLALLSLFIFGKKKKFYPAMPYLTVGIFLGMLIGWFAFVL